MYSDLLAPIRQFLSCETPNAWLQQAVKPDNLPVLLIDHLLCELKAAQAAMLMIRKYAVDKDSGDALLNWLKPYEAYVYRREGDWRELSKFNTLKKAMIPKSSSAFEQDLIDKMVLLIKEELHHFYQVLEIMHEMNVPYQNIEAGKYAAGLLKHVRTHEPATLVDRLICGAFIEARSCERFAALAPLVDQRLSDFYVSLLRSEARHYQDYLSLAQMLTEDDLAPRVAYFAGVEKSLITGADSDFKFHSGVLV